MSAPVSLSIHIIGHVARHGRASGLAAHLAPSTLHLDDGSLGTWGNHRRALAAALASGASHAVVLEDDATPVSGFDVAAAAAARTRPKDLIGLYVGKQRPSPGRVDRAVREADAIKANWLVCDQLLWAVGYIVPTRELEAVLRFADDFPDLSTDRRIGTAWGLVTRRPVAYTWPSLVDHDDQLEQTTTEHPARERGRVAHRVGYATGNEQSVRITL